MTTSRLFATLKFLVTEPKALLLVPTNVCFGLLSSSSVSVGRRGSSAAARDLESSAIS